MQKTNYYLKLLLKYCCVFGLFLSATQSFSNEIIEIHRTDTPVLQQSVSGTVTSANDSMPLPGVNVVEKGTTNGVVTDFDGNYDIQVSGPEAILVFTYIGFKPEEIPVEDQSEVNIALEASTSNLDEVVVVGYGTQKKTNLTGSVGTVGEEAFESRPVQDASQMLQGQVAGLNITSNGGSLDNDASINIRGVATIGQGSTGEPLILIDGMQGALNALHPQDIENISVLKDAAASSIYGSRAPFGVILVTTKSGRTGVTSVNFSNNVRVSKPLYVPDMMDSYNFALYFNAASENEGQTGYFIPERIERIQAVQNGTLAATTIPDPDDPTRWGTGYTFGNSNEDWYDIIYRNQSFSQEYNLSARGGSETVNYYVSANHLNQDGLLEYNNDEFERYTVTAKVDIKLSDWASFKISNRFIREDFGIPSYFNEAFYRNLARQGWPTLPLLDPNGFLGPYHALAFRDGGRRTTQKDWLYQQGQLVLTPLKGLEVFGEFNYRTRNNLEHTDVLQTFERNVAGEPLIRNTDSSVGEEAVKNNYFSTNLYSKYAFSLQDAHNFEVLLGMQSELNKNKELFARRVGVIIPANPVLDLTSGTDFNGNVVAPSVSGELEEWATTGVFSRLNYNYKQRYLFEANIRYDGTSRFRSDKRWRWFPSFSAGWNLAEEEFWNGTILDKIGLFKFRGSWGELGNQNTRALYPTYVTVPFGPASGSWLINSARPNVASAPGLVSQTLTWETVRSWNVGFDASAFNNRLTLNFDYFNRYTLDMVGPAPELPLTLGTAVPRTNNTDLKTYGFELGLSWRDSFENGFGYGIDILLSDSQSEVTRYPNDTQSLNTFRTGQMLGEIWGWQTIGIARTDAEMEAHLASLPNGGQDALGRNWAAGDIMYEDLNGDGLLDQGSFTLDDRGDTKIIGNDTARFPFSFTLSANWKGFDFRGFMQGILKRDYFQDSYYFWGAHSRGLFQSTGFTQHLDYHRNPDDPLGANLNSYYPRPVFDNKNQQTQTGYLQDASYLRLKNLQLGYSLPESFTDRAGFTKVRVYFSGENLLTFTNLTDIFDPETIDKIEDVGFGGNAYPIPQTFSFGVNLNF